jgi:hypothetical protein
MPRASHGLAAVMLALLAACADTAATTDDVTAADADRDGTLNECRTRAAIAVSPAAGRGMTGYDHFDRAVAQCLRNKRKKL